MTGLQTPAAGMSMQPKRRLTLMYPEGMDAEAWAAAHRQGEVPGRFPYGLDRLKEFGLELSCGTIRPAARNVLPWLGMLRPSRWLRRAVRPHEGLMMAWDEQTSAAMYARYANSGYGLIGGVIWATDRLHAGEQRARLTVLRHILSRLDTVWALSRAQLPVLREWLDLPESRIRFVPFGIDTDFYPQQPLPDRPTVLSLGNDRDRDPATLLAALRQVKEALPETRIIVQTPGNTPLPEGFDSLGRLTGPQVRALYAEASVVAIATKPNLHVSGMTTALESMSTGRPVVLSATGGADDYLLDGETGRLVRAGAPGDMATAVIELLTDQAELQRMGSAAATYVRQQHTQQTMAAAFAEIAFQTLGEGHENSSPDTRNRPWARQFGSPGRQRAGGAE